MGRTIGIAELKDSLSAVVDEVMKGATVTVTNRSRPVALFVPYQGQVLDDQAASLRSAGLIQWKGGKPKGIVDGPDMNAAPLAEAVSEDRR